jgi:UDPglucose 6-dehydrogenase
MKVGIVGLGTVGGTLRDALQAAGVRARGYDPYLGVGAPEVLADCSLVFLCVPTPAGAQGELDVSPLWKAVRDIEACLMDHTVVVIKSTVPPATSDALSADFQRFEFANVPEFLVAARPMETLTKPDRVVVGAGTDAVARTVIDVMRLIAPEAPILTLTPLEAELAKLSANAMLGAKVAVANDLALVCERFGVPWSRVQAAVGLDRRIGLDHLSVSEERGFGGACLPKDLDGLVAASRSEGYPAPLLQMVADFNRAIRARPSPDGHHTRRAQMEPLDEVRAAQ